MQRRALIAMLMTLLLRSATAGPQDAKAVRNGLAKQLQAQLGHVLTVQKDGIGAIPGQGVGFGVPSYGSNYKNGRMKSDVMSSLVSAKVEGLRNLSIGEGVYLLRVQVSDSNVVLEVQACGACNAAQPEPFPLRANVTFPFGKGFIETTRQEQMLSVIGEVFSRGDAASEPTAAVAEAPPVSQPAQPVQATPPPDPPAEPAKVELGQSVEQVEGILGRPDRVADLGNKKIYLYKDLKIIFMDGRVSDVQ